jgi:hypothetical protein
VKESTVTDPSGEVTYQDTDVKTRAPDGTWSKIIGEGLPEPQPGGGPGLGDPDGGPDEAGRPADDGTMAAPHGPGGIIGQLIEDYINTHGDEGGGDEDAPFVAVGRQADGLVTRFRRTSGDGSEGPGHVSVDLRVPVLPGALDDWGEHNDPRLNTGFAEVIAAVALRVEQAAVRVAR